ncbi:carbohydrate sulfotransferase 15-like [Ruditapes philippinarum]|uniref:carbohydrate sulfotransferase 15-like n=1 Tax=Ruditapes philippinarum TaxID=129788 RepID=UPI00295ABE69|nr:carbohydrate sulfotransferase 15-like [Ruditapes philippinarum]
MAMRSVCQGDVRKRIIFILTTTTILIDIFLLNSLILSNVKFQFVTKTSMTLRINDGADDKKNAVDGETTTVDNTTLSHVSQMITDIAESYREADDIVNAGNKRNFYCPPFPRKKHGVEDLMCMHAPKFLPEYKNPCWFSLIGKFRCLPYFQIIGIDKSGTTDLFDKIAKHPDVLRNEGILQKETMWWSWLRYGHKLKESRDIQNFKTYLQYFTKAAYAIRSETGSRLITGDATPMDFWDMSGWKVIPQNSRLKEPVIITPHLIKHMNPHVKLVLILRDPIERLLSDYFFLQQGVMTVEGFHLEVVKSIVKLHLCTRQNTLRGCLYDRNLHVGLNARIHLGFYSVFLKDWFKVFPREQFFIVTTEMYSQYPDLVLKQVYSFLGLRKLTGEEIDLIATAKRQYVTKNKANKMLNETRAILEQLYAPFTQELGAILEDKSFLWKEKMITT